MDSHLHRGIHEFVYSFCQVIKKNWLIDSLDELIYSIWYVI